MKKQASGVRGQGSAKPRNPLLITAPRVKAALAQGKANLGEICARLDIPEADFKGRDQVRRILRDLENFQQIKVEGENGVWVFSWLNKPGARGAVQEKLWEFMCLRFAKVQPWSAREAAKKAECTGDYARRYTGFLEGIKHIEPMGQKGSAVLYRVVPGKEKEPPPHWNRRGEKRIQKERENFDQRGPEHFHCTCAIPASGQKEITPGPPLSKGGEASPQERLDAALKGFFHLIVEIAGSCDRAIEIIQEMKTTLLAVQEIAREKPTEDHHQ